MNIYQVVSEVLTGYDYVCEEISVPVDYCIAQLVVAGSRDQAKYVAWKTDRQSFYPSDINEMPRMSVRIVKKDVVGPARLVTKDPECQQLWKE